MCAGVSLETYCIGYYTSCKRYCPSMSLLACGMVLPLWLPFAVLLSYLSLCYILENFPIESLSLLSTPYSLCTLGSANAIMNKRQWPQEKQVLLGAHSCWKQRFPFHKISETRRSQTRSDFGHLWCFAGVKCCDFGYGILSFYRLRGF